MTTEFDEHGDALLIRLHETGPQNIEEFLASRDVDVDESFDLAKDLEGRGLVKAIYTFGASQCSLTGSGRRRAQQLIKEQPARRRKALHQCMLAWLEDHPYTWKGFLTSDHAHFDGVAFTEADLKREAKYFYDRGYITATRIEDEPEGRINPEITADGRDFLHGHGDRPGSIIENRFGPTFNGPMPGAQVAWDNGHVRQSQRSVEDDPE